VSDIPPYAVGRCAYCDSEMVVYCYYDKDEPLKDKRLYPPERYCPGRNPNLLHIFEQETLSYPSKGCIVIWQEEACE